MKSKQDMFETLVSIAVDLTAAISAEDRYNRLLDALKQVIPYDAAALLRYEDDELIPIASRGLSLGAMGRRYSRQKHPRLDMICESSEPIRFESESHLPDPFDGLLVDDHQAIEQIHSCMGCPLFAHDRLIGILTADALDPNAFDNLNQDFLVAISALAGIQLQTADLVNALEEAAYRQGQIAKDLMQDIQTRHGSEIVGNSQMMHHLRREIELVARSELTVLVLGETGVGKELVIAAIHKLSNRSSGPMLYLNCAALPDNLAESELFGHTKGSFTGATSDRAGKFEVADGGTLFLDEIGELSLPIQAKLLRAIQEGEIQRVGSEQTKKVNVRLLAATNRNLEKEVEAGRFRADLYHRLNVYPIRVPPLRERKSDIQLLAGYFCERMQRQLGTGQIRISMASMELLSAYSWPGNVRELENMLSRAILKAASGRAQQEQITIQPKDLGIDPSDTGKVIAAPSAPDSVSQLWDPSKSLREQTVDFQKRLIQSALDRNNGNWAASARDLGMHRSNLHNLAKRLGLISTD